MVSRLPSLAGKSQPVAWALGLTICYQFVYQSIMLGKLQDSERAEAEAHILDARVALAKLPFSLCEDTGNGGGKADSDVCGEVARFREWRQDELDMLRSVKHVAEKSANVSSSASVLAATAPLVPLGTTTTMSATTSVTVKSEHEKNMEAFDKLYNETLASIRAPPPPSPWVESLRALKAKFASKPHHATAPVPTPAPTPSSIIISETSLTPWARDLMALQARMEKGMELSRSSHHYHHATTVHKTLMADIHDFGEELCKTSDRWNYSACVGILRSGQNFSAHPLLTKLELHNGMASHAAAFNIAEPSHKESQQDFGKEIADYGRRLCSDPNRRNYSACAPFGGSNKSSSSTTVGIEAKAPNLRGTGSMLRLDWSDVVGKMSEHKRVGGDFKVSQKQVQFAKWQGRIPKVACIAAIPSGSDAQFRLKYFLDNFALQTYEGPRQLILVYQSSNTKLDELVRENADGRYIKAAALNDRFNDHGKFPSTAALRYGAFLADADIIAHWSFDEWHHPQRLEWQVRALAKVVRPVSLISTHYVNETTLSDAVLSETSFVGEASWAQLQWMPYTGTVYLARDTVQVNIPELSAYKIEASSGWEVALEHFHSQTPSTDPTAKKELKSEVNSEREFTNTDVKGQAEVTDAQFAQDGAHLCANVTSTSAMSQGDSDVAGVIQKAVGTSFASTFNGLMQKRDEIALTLLALCHEAQSERAGPRQNELFAHAKQVDAIHRHIIGHFDAVEVLFQNASTLDV